MNSHLSMENEILNQLSNANEKSWLQCGILWESMQEPDKAMFCYENALRHNQCNVQALTQVASIHRIKERHLEAIEYFQKVLTVDTTNGEIWGALGHCYLMIEDLQKAYSAYQQALYLLSNPKDPNLWYGIGILYDRYGSFEHAEEAFNAVLKMDPNFEKRNEIYFRLGIIYKQQQKHDKALNCFKLILSKPPHPLVQGDLWFQIGHVYELKKSFALAKDAYERVLKETPTHAKVLQQLGWLYHHHNDPTLDLGNQDIAISFLMRSLDTDSGDGQTWYLLGRCYMAQQKYRKAYDAYQQAVYRDGRNPTFWCSIGVLYYQINQYRDALDAYSRAIRLNPYLSEVWYDLGTLYESCTQLSDSLDAYQRAAELDPNNKHIQQRLNMLRQTIEREAKCEKPKSVPSNIGAPSSISSPLPSTPLLPSSSPLMTTHLPPTQTVTPSPLLSPLCSHLSNSSPQNGPQDRLSTTDRTSGLLSRSMSIHGNGEGILSSGPHERSLLERPGTPLERIGLERSLDRPIIIDRFDRERLERMDRGLDRLMDRPIIDRDRLLEKPIERGLDRSIDRMERTLLDRTMERMDTVDRGMERSIDRNQERGMERSGSGLERGMERGIDRNQERGIERSGSDRMLDRLERGVERNMERGAERSIDRVPSERPPPERTLSGSASLSREERSDRNTERPSDRGLERLTDRSTTLENPEFETSARDTDRNTGSSKPKNTNGGSSPTSGQSFGNPPPERNAAKISKAKIEQYLRREREQAKGASPASSSTVSPPSPSYKTTSKSGKSEKKIDEKNKKSFETKYAEEIPKHSESGNFENKESPPRTPDSPGGSTSRPGGKPGASVSSIVSGIDEEEAIGSRLRRGSIGKADNIKPKSWFTDSENIKSSRENFENKLAPLNITSNNKSDVQKLRRLSEMESPSLEGLGIEAERERLRLNQESGQDTHNSPTNDMNVDSKTVDTHSETGGDSTIGKEDEAELKRTRDEEKEESEPNPKRQRVNNNNKDD